MNSPLDGAWVDAFVAVSDHLNFGRAALSLHVTQSTVSHRIRRLEETLGVELFDRSRRQIVLTPAGRAFLRRARPALADLARAVEDARASAAAARQRLVVGYVGSLAAHPLMEAVVEVASAFPRFAIETQHRSTHDQIAAVRSGELDVGSSFVQTPPVPDDLVEHRLPPAVVWLWVSDRHRLAEATEVTRKELARERLVLLSTRAEPAYRLPQSWLRSGEAAPIEVDSLDAALALVSHDVGVLLLPELRVEVRGVRRIATQERASTLRLFWRRGDASPPLAALLEAIATRGLIASAAAPRGGE